MARRIIESVEVEPAPLRMLLDSKALEGTLKTLRRRISDFEAQLNSPHPQTSRLANNWSVIELSWWK